MRILLVDAHSEDEAAVRRVLTRSVPDGVLMVAASAAEALRRLSAEPFDAVLLDLSLPDLPGNHLLGEMHRSWPDLPVVCITPGAGAQAATAIIRLAESGELPSFETSSSDRKDVRRSLAHAVSRLRAAQEAVVWLEELAYRDPLTELYNRRFLDERIAAEIQRSRRHQRELAVVLSDVDRFKRINDTFGHKAGDAALVTVASAVRDTFRSEDVPARIGGDEFVVLLPEISAEGAEAAAGRLVDRVRSTAATLGLTLSCGVAAWRDDEPPESLIARADAALYRAKAEGGDRVSVERRAPRESVSIAPSLRRP